MHILFLVLFSLTSFSSNLLAQSGYNHISLTNSNLCASTSDTVTCWGPYGYNVSPVITGFRNIRILKISDHYGCAVDDEGLVCWGSHPYLEKEFKTLEIEKLSLDWSEPCVLSGSKLHCTDDQTSAPIPMDAISDFDRDSGIICAVRKNKLSCWGRSYGTEDLVQKAPTHLENVEKVWLNFKTACVSTADKSIHCWGDTREGKLLPPVTNLKVKDIHLNITSGCLLDEANQITCWGSYRPPKESFESISSSFDSYCGLTSTGFISCWGWKNEHHRLPPKLSNIQHIALAERGACYGSKDSIKCSGTKRIVTDQDVNHLKFLTANFGTLCWIDDTGANCRGDDEALANIPPSLKNITSISIGQDAACAIADGKLGCWGNDLYGLTLPPVDLMNVRKVDVGYYHACAFNSSNEIKCWGKRAVIPPQIEGEIIDLSVGESFTCVLTRNHLITCWPHKENFIPLDISRSSMFVPGAKGLVAGNSFACAHSDTTVECWGSNFYGQLVPPKVVGKIHSIEANFEYACLRDDEGIKCWGFILEAQNQFFQ